MPARLRPGVLFLSCACFLCSGCIDTLVRAIADPSGLAKDVATAAAQEMAADTVSSIIPARDAVSLARLEDAASSIDGILARHPDAVNAEDLRRLKQKLDSQPKPPGHQAMAAVPASRRPGGLEGRTQVENPFVPASPTVVGNRGHSGLAVPRQSGYPEAATGRWVPVTGVQGIQRHSFIPDMKDMPLP